MYLNIYIFGRWQKLQFGLKIYTAPKLKINIFDFQENGHFYRLKVAKLLITTVTLVNEHGTGTYV
jgi:hypothetical protein